MFCVVAKAGPLESPTDEYLIYRDPVNRYMVARGNNYGACLARGDG